MYGYTVCSQMYLATYIKKPMKECTGKEITEEWLYHLGVPVDEIEELAKNQCSIAYLL